VHFIEEFNYHLDFNVSCRFLHTGEVRGSSSRSPTKPFPRNAYPIQVPLDCSRGITKKTVLEAYRFFRRRPSASGRVNSS
jgi:hypothetical protein